MEDRQSPIILGLRMIVCIVTITIVIVRDHLHILTSRLEARSCFAAGTSNAQIVRSCQSIAEFARMRVRFPEFWPVWLG